MICLPRRLAALAAALLLAGPAQAEIRNAPGPRALEFAAYVFAASNVCGYRIDTDQFEALLAKQSTTSRDVSPRGPFGARVQTMFALMSNEMARDRARSCLAIDAEYGKEGTVARNLLLPADAPAAQSPPPAEPPAQAPAPVTPR